MLYIGLFNLIWGCFTKFKFIGLFCRMLWRFLRIFSLSLHSDNSIASYIFYGRGLCNLLKGSFAEIYRARRMLYIGPFYLVWRYFTQFKFIGLFGRMLWRFLLSLSPL